jgi:hypothetical protein
MTLISYYIEVPINQLNLEESNLYFKGAQYFYW